MIELPDNIKALVDAAGLTGGASSKERTEVGEKTVLGNTCDVKQCGGHDNPAVLAAAAAVMDSGRGADLAREQGGFGR